MTQANRVANLRRHIEAGTLTRHTWGDGHERACLLAALAPECAVEASASACPAEVMPQWLAYLTPWMDDRGSVDAWPAMVRRYADLAARWHVLSVEQWERLDYLARIAALNECREHAPDTVDPVIALCQRAADGDMPARGEWDAAGDAAGDAWAAGGDAGAAARAAAGDAWAAAGDAWAAGRGAGAAARAAARAAAWASMRDAMRDAAAADRITAAILDAIEAQIVRAN